MTSLADRKTRRGIFPFIGLSGSSFRNEDEQRSAFAAAALIAANCYEGRKRPVKTRTHAIDGHTTR